MSAVKTVPLADLVEEAQRVLSICNACRYCEGYCAVFPALERRLEFSADDVHYLANLCHNCGACLYSCQYAPPHEFQLNFPRVLAQVRRQTYRKYAWPGFLAGAFDRNGIVVGLALAASLAAAFLLVMFYADPARFFAAWQDSQGSFYAVLPHKRWPRLRRRLPSGRFSSRCPSRDSGATGRRARRVRARTLGGGRAWTRSACATSTAEARCTYPDERPPTRGGPSPLHLYGFALLRRDSVETSTTTHGWPAPYPGFSLPVILECWRRGPPSSAPSALWLRSRSAPSSRTPAGGMTRLLALLLAVSATGLALLFLRETRAMGVLLAVHLGCVLALFVTMPYGKFVHALYRFAALVRFHVERRRPLPQLGTE